MINKDLSFSEFSPKIARLMTQALYIALVNDSGVDGPFKVEDEALTSKVLSVTLHDRVLHVGTDTLIYDALQYTISDFEQWVAGRDDSQTEEQAINEYNQMHGSNFNANTLEILKYLAFNISQTSSITSALDGDSNLDICLRQCQRVVDSESLQRQDALVSVVIDGVMFTFANDTMVAHSIKTAIEQMAAAKEV